jgi:glutathione peroxidase
MFNTKWSSIFRNKFFSSKTNRLNSRILFATLSTSLLINYLAKKSIVEAEESKSVYETPQKSLFEFQLPDIEGRTLDFSQFKGKVCILVNSGTESNLSEAHFVQLQYLHDKYRSQGLEIIIVPCNAFGKENKSNSEIMRFIRQNYGTTNMIILGRIDNINGKQVETHPLFFFARTQLPGKRWYGSWYIPYNWTKFMFDHNGEGAKRYDFNVLPLDFEEDIVQLLAKRNENQD